jgi:hypothetical protein
MVSFNPSTSLRSGSSLSNLSHFEALQKIAREEFGLQSVIFRDSLKTAQEVITVLRDLKERRYDLSGISIVVSEKAFKAKNRWVINIPHTAPEEWINDVFQALKYTLSPHEQSITDPIEQRKILENPSIGGLACYTIKGSKQRPLIILDPLHNYSSEQIHEIIYHELGHALHYKRLAKYIDKAPMNMNNIKGKGKSKFELIKWVNYEAFKKLYAALGFLDNGVPTKLPKKLIARRLTPYGCVNVFEFVAVYFQEAMSQSSSKPTEAYPFYKKVMHVFESFRLKWIYMKLKGPKILPKPSKS